MTTNNQATNTDQTHALKPNYGLTKPSTAFFLLFEAAKNTLTTDQLEYLSGFSEQAMMEAKDLSDTLMMIGSLIYSAEAENLPRGEKIGQMLWVYASHLEHIAGMMCFASDAKFELVKRKEQKRA